MADNKIDNFKKELKDLLEKYNAEISTEIQGDTHGIDYEAIVIEVDGKEVIRVQDCCISHFDIKTAK